MKHIFLFIFSLMIIDHISSGQVSNPFDIQSRLKNKTFTKQSDTLNDNISSNDSSTANKDTLKTILVNPFDIDRNKIDSIYEEFESVGQNKKLSLNFNANYLKKTFSGNNSSFLIWVILFGLIIIAVIVSMNRDTVLKIIRSSWFNNIMNLLHRNFSNKDIILYSFLYLNFALNLSIFLYIILANHQNMNGFGLFSSLLLMICLIYAFKHLMIYIFEMIFTSLKGIRFYSFSVMIFNIILGLALIPVNAFAAFSPGTVAEVFIVAGVVLLIIFYTFRLFRGFLSTYNYFVISIFHFFIYLCAFEIIPLLILYKVVVSF
ncbi:MAG: DUF4271 domain-containing protein [Deltaproteobacteria bacterium]